MFEKGVFGYVAEGLFKVVSVKLIKIKVKMRIVYKANDTQK
jgi:hypothetical protein